MTKKKHHRQPSYLVVLSVKPAVSLGWERINFHFSNSKRLIAHNEEFEEQRMSH